MTKRITSNITVLHVTLAAIDPWGSGGDNVNKRNRDFLDTVNSLRRQGLSDPEIAKAMGIPSTTDFRQMKSIAKNEQRQSQIAMAQRLKDNGWGNVAIGERMGIPESSVRAMLAPGQKDRADVLETTAKMLKEEVDSKKYLDVGKGAELDPRLGISKEKLATAVGMLEEQGYRLHYVKLEQPGTGLKTTYKVLAPPGVTSSEVYHNRDKIQQISSHTEDGGRSWLGLAPPLSVNPNRVAIRYAEDGGTEADGVVYVRPGVADLSLGGSRYAQVRIAVGDKHFIKGMAMYKDDLPEGVDLQFNTNKSDTGNKLDALKPMKTLREDPSKVDMDNPFGAVIDRQITVKDSNGKDVATSAMNIVNDEGNWEKWNKSIASQVLSKQSPKLAKAQLDLTYKSKRESLDEIKSLTNPAVRKKLLEEYADSADSAAVHLKAAALPRQATHVILPVKSLKETEIYAPNYNPGERVVLIRYPHGGTFEIPELTVNNNNREAKSLLGTAKDAVGINPEVAKRLSGADFDGDTVLVIPNNAGKIKTTPALTKLKDFDPIRSYPRYEGMPKMSPQTKQNEMGKISNLITDMTLQGANPQEIAQAVRHSMVVIDAEKHDLDYKRSARDNGIAQLKAKYQSNSKKQGASTLISRASSDLRVPARKPRPAALGGPVDKVTGERKYVPTGETYVNKQGKVVLKTTKTTRLKEATDAHSLSSGTTVMETIYADHSNRLKALANEARREAVNTKSAPYSPSAKAAYSKEVASLDSKLRIAEKNATRERQAVVVSNAIIAAKRRDYPDMDAADLKKIKSQALAEARSRTGAGKQRIVVSEEEWSAIQAGAISTHKLNKILANADMDSIKKLATPRSTILMTSSKTQRAQSLLAAGHTQADVASILGVSLTTLKASLS